MHTPCCTVLSLWATNTRGCCHRQMTITLSSNNSKQGTFWKEGGHELRPCKKEGTHRTSQVFLHDSYTRRYSWCCDLLTLSTHTCTPEAPAQSLHMYVIAAPFPTARKQPICSSTSDIQKTQSTPRPSTQQHQGASMAHAPTRIAKTVKEEAKHKSHVCTTSTLQA